MFRSHKLLQYILLVSLFVVLAVEPAYADDVFQTIKGRAVAFLVGLKPVIFILAAFGLIGFAWMAIFGQISWKWFANIAMGLFLVANMGLFIDYFAKKGDKNGSVAPGTYSQLLGRAIYKDNMGAGYQGTSGTAGDPDEQSSMSNDGTGGASSSDQLESELDKKINGATSPEECDAAGGDWVDNSCSAKSSSGGKEEIGNGDQGQSGENNTSDNQENLKKLACVGAGNDWDETTKTCKEKSVADKAREELEMLECDQRGGTYENGKCSGGCSEGQSKLNGKCVDKAEADCYNSNGWSYTKEWGCLTQDEYQNKRANEKRRCESIDGHEWVDDKYNLRGVGECKKTKKAGKEDCKIIYGSDYEFNYTTQQCEKKESVLKKECEQDKNNVYKDGKCITKQQDCTNNGKVWQNGKCISKKDECEQDKNKVYKNGKCITKQQDCTNNGKIWQNGKCITKEEDCTSKGKVWQWRTGQCVTKEQDCTDNGKVWDNGSCISKKQACLKTPGYFWSDDYSKCIKDEGWGL